MKRGGRLERRTPLSQGDKPLTRGKPMKRGRPNARKVRRAKVLDPRPDISDLRERVFERAGGRCDLCGEALRWSAWECHHRQKRTQGGPDSMPNLIALHPRCHSERVHGRPAWSYANGFMVRRNGDPAQMPMLRHRARWQIPGETQWRGAPPLSGRAVA